MLNNQKIAEPMGIVAGIVPMTNPTSTAIFKALLALKTLNGIIFSPHLRAKKCTIEAAKTVLEAAVNAGAPNIIDWIDEPNVELCQQLMQHPKIDLILATGAVEQLKRQLDIPMTIKEALKGEEKEFYERAEDLAVQAFDAQCTGANPRYPLIRDLKELYVLAYRGCRVDATLCCKEKPI